MDGDGGGETRDASEGAGEPRRDDITNAIPDPHGSARIALLFGFN